MALGDSLISVLLTANDQTAAGINSARTGLDGLQTTASKINSTLAGLGLGLSLAGLAAGIKGIADDMDDAYKSAQKLGLSTETFTALKYAAEQSGLTVDQFAASFTRLNKNLAEAGSDAGSSVAAAFRALSIEVLNTDGSLRDADAVLLDLANRFAEMPDGVGKAARAMDIFGKSGTDMLPFLNAGAAGIEALKQEAASLGLVITDAAGAAAEKFNDDLARMEAAIKGAALAAADVGAFDTLTGALKILTVGASAVWETLELVGKTLANIAYSVANLDFENYRARQQQALAEARDDVGKVTEKIFALKTGLEDTAKTGEKSSTGLASGFKAVELSAAESAKRIKELEKVLTPLEQAYKDLGITSQAALDAAAKKAKEAFDTISKSNAPLNDLNAAWKAYADAAIAANGGVASTTIQAEAAMRGYIVSVDDAGKATIKLKDVTEDWGKNVEKAAAQASQAMGEAAAESARVWFDEMGAGTGGMQDSINDFHTRLKGLGDLMTQHINAVRQRVDDLTNSSEQARAAIQAAITAPQAISGTTIGAYLAFIHEAANQITEDYKKQKEAADRYIESIKDGFAQLGGAAGQAAIDTDLLDQQTLDRLRAAIADAKQRMLDLRDATRDTLSGIQDEWDSLNNNLDEIERRRYEKRKAEIEAQLAAARAAGDQESIRNLQESLRLLKQIADVREEEARKQEQENRRNGSSGPSRGDRTGGTSGSGDRSTGGGGFAPGAPGAPSYTLNFQGPVFDPDTLARTILPAINRINKLGS